MNELLAAAERLKGRDIAEYQGPTGDDTDMRAAILLARFFTDLAASLTVDVVESAGRLRTCFEPKQFEHADAFFVLDFALPIISKLREGT